MTTNDQSGERHRFSGPHGSAITHVSIDEALSNNWLEICTSRKSISDASAWRALKRF
jgi:hypothetical protein